MDSYGEGADISLSGCTNDYTESAGACLVNDCKFQGSSAGKKGGVLQVGSFSNWHETNVIGSVVEVNRCTVKGIVCGEVSLLIFRTC